MLTDVYLTLAQARVTLGPNTEIPLEQAIETGNLRCRVRDDGILYIKYTDVLLLRARSRRHAEQRLARELEQEAEALKAARTLKAVTDARRAA